MPATPKTAMESVTLNLEASNKYRENLEESPGFAKLMEFTSFEAKELDPELEKLDEAIASGTYARLEKVDHRDLATIKRDYCYINKGRRAVYVHGFRSKLIKQCMDKASRLVLELGESE